MSQDNSAAAVTSTFDIEEWKWASRHEFMDFRKFLESRCCQDIYYSLAQGGGLQQLVDDGVPLDALDDFIREAAHRMYTARS
jgi:hypothetical protein